VLLGPTASGAAVVDSKAIWDRIKDANKDVIAIDMEAYAVAFAGQEAPLPKPKVLISKSVCDFGLKKTDGAQEYAAYTSVRFFRLYLNRYYDMFTPQIA
jgi:nucleoside phosphorylase